MEQNLKKRPYFVTSVILLAVSVMAGALLGYMEAYDHTHSNIFGKLFLAIPVLYVVGGLFYFRSMDEKKIKAGFLLMFLPIFYVTVWFLSFMVRAS